MSYTQSITVAIHSSGAQQVQVSSHGDGERGASITVTVNQVLIHLHDAAAVCTYAEAFLWAGEVAIRVLPMVVTSEPSPYMPGVIVRAYGRDEVALTGDIASGTLRVKTGQFIWIFHDRAAYDSVTVAFRHARALADVVFARTRRGAHADGKDLAPGR